MAPVDDACEHGAMVEQSASSVRISLLGGLRVDIDGDPVGSLPRKCQELLAALALDPTAAIPVSRLVTLLWGDDPPRTAEKTLQTYVARLRRELGPSAISRVGSAYRLDVDPEAIDVSRFRSALKRNDVGAAVDEWAGTPLAGVETTGLQPLLDGLTEEWLDAVESQLERSVDEDPGSAVGRLTELVADHPFREGLRALLMTALYRTDRQAEALDAYRRARTTLVDELGVEPGQRLRDLEQSILQQDVRLDRPAGTDRRRARSTPTGTVTFAFAHVADVATLWSEHPDAAANALAAFGDAVADTADEHGGVVFVRGTETAGIAFDRAHEALDWVRACRGSIASIDVPNGAVVEVQIGLHTGDAEERSGAYYGPAVTLAERLAAIGAAGQTIATNVTALLSGVEHRVLGTFSIDGLVGEHELCQIGPGNHPPIRTSGGDLASLPATPNALVGRGSMIAAVNDALEARSVVTLVGPGGIGKTRVAVEAARRRGRAGRIFFVSLAEIAEPTDVMQAAADVIGARPTAGRVLVDAIAATLAARPSLVVLDNCEHVVDGVADLVDELTGRCTDVTVLATSREGLGVAGESIIPVGPLDPDSDGADLFLERAGAPHGSGLDRSTVEAVCRRLDGVPLAIELAAARVQSISPDDLLARLDDSFRLLTGSRRRTLERHRTLHATMRWSYDLLSEDEQRLFRRLSVFSGPFDLRAAEVVVVDDHLRVGEVGALLADLVDRSMCIVESGTVGRRFRLLEPMRQFGLDQLDADGSDDDLRRRHAEHVRNRLAEIQVALSGPDEIAGAAALEELWPNLRVAFDWSIDQRHVELALGLLQPVAAQGFLRRGLGELGEWVARIADVADTTDSDAVGFALLWTSIYAQQSEDRSAFDRLAAGREADTPFGRLAHAVIAGDSAAVLTALPDATNEAVGGGDTLAVLLFEILTVGNLIQLGREDDAAARLDQTLADSRRPIPPTLVTWLLFMQSTLRTLRGEEPAEDDPFDPIATMALPPRTNSPTPSLAARRAARAGDLLGAALLLREHVDDLTAAGAANGALIVAVEFVSILVDHQRFAEAASLLAALDAHDVDEIVGMSAMLTDVRARVAVEHPVAETTRAHGAEDASVPDLLAVVSGVLDEVLSA